MLCTPSDNPPTGIDHAPVAEAVLLPSSVLPSNNSTSEPASAVPLKLSTVLLVTLSELEMPLSLAAARSGNETAGARCRLSPESTMNSHSRFLHHRWRGL